MNAMFTVASAVQTLPETIPVSFEWIRNFYLLAGSDKSYHLEGILCFAIIP